MVAAKARGKIPNGCEEELWGQAMCRHWGRGAEPAPGLGLSHKHGWEAFAGAECSSQAGSKGKRLYFPNLKKFLLVLDLH